MSALATALEATGATIWRDTDLSRDVPPGGMINLAEGTYTPEPVLSPLSYFHEMPVTVVATIVAADEPARNAAIDALLQSISALLLADRTLGGAVETLTIDDAPDFQPFEDNGAATAAHFTVTLMFTTVGSPLA